MTQQPTTPPAGIRPAQLDQRMEREFAEVGRLEHLAREAAEDFECLADEAAERYKKLALHVEEQTAELLRALII